MLYDLVIRVPAVRARDLDGRKRADHAAAREREPRADRRVLEREHVARGACRTPEGSCLGPGKREGMGTFHEGMGCTPSARETAFWPPSIRRTIRWRPE